tara:strand:- start:331 stop:1419 length:1089 start_codon:yes stop_codon:yes gene_type:complete
MKVNGKKYTSIWRNDQKQVFVIDQRFLPHEFKVVELKTLNDFCLAIKDMLVRGAPLIGVTAAYGVAVSFLAGYKKNDLDLICKTLLETRPTAVNLFWALEEMKKFLSSINKKDVVEYAFKKADEILEFDIVSNKKIGEFGLGVIQQILKKKQSNKINILTHCNAGWLATVDWGTATSPIYHAQQKGIDIHVFVDETRPRNQGAQLTVWELNHNNVSHELIVDNAGGHLMQHGEIDMVLVGSDRATATGDVCNKIGTYLKALSAYDNKIPFYVALPTSTIDWTLKNGLTEIPIEERDHEEVSHIQGLLDDDYIKKVNITLIGTSCRNPAFDVTPSRLVSGLITDYGVYKANENSLKPLKAMVT